MTSWPADSRPSRCCSRCCSARRYGQWGPLPRARWPAPGAPRRRAGTRAVRPARERRRPDRPREQGPESWAGHRQDRTVAERSGQDLDTRRWPAPNDRRANDGPRTRDLRLGKPTLYQLSYVRDAATDSRRTDPDASIGPAVRSQPARRTAVDGLGATKPQHFPHTPRSPTACAGFCCPAELPPHARSAEVTRAASSSPSRPPVRDPTHAAPPPPSPRSSGRLRPPGAGHARPPPHVRPSRP